ncbi:uncharacterized protein [Lepeophtheirus salmonis]|uniref:uncharacterized protein n=1 Tax=Lepeophtheirus salmonis TaxID=72036 RepID=UPI001AEA929C|nr:autism susceptibility gene 2 protein homolog [Lepeophtheirus salmonis]
MVIDESVIRMSKEEEEDEEELIQKEALYAEDIVEGFSFLSFDSYDDLQKVAKWSGLHNGKLPDPYSVLTFEKEENKSKKKKKKREQNLTSNAKELDKLVESNGDKGSTGSNSEKGYICDSDSDDEKGSENGVDDLFNSRKSSSGSSTPCQQNGVTNVSTPTSACSSIISCSNSNVPQVSTSTSSTTASAPPTAIVTPSVIVSTVPSTSNTTVTPSATVTSKSFFRPYSISPPPNSNTKKQCKEEEEDSPLVVHHHPAYRPSFSGGYSPYHPPVSTGTQNNKRPYDYSQFIPPQSSYYPHHHSPSTHHPPPQHYPSHNYNLPLRDNSSLREDYSPDAKRLAYSGVGSNFGPQGYSNKSVHPHYPSNFPKHPYSSGHKGPVPSSVPSSTSISIHSASSLRENSSRNSSTRPSVRSGVTPSPSMATTALTPGITSGMPSSASASSINSRNVIRHELDSRYFPGSSPYLMHPRSDILLPGGPSRPVGPSYLSNSMLKDVPKVGVSEDPFNYQRTSSSSSSIGKPPSYSAPLRPSLSSSSAPTTTSFTTPSVQGSVAPKKSGKWNAMHVRIAWEIYNHQQKQKPDHKNSQPNSTPTAVTTTTPSLSSKIEASKPKAPHHYYLPSETAKIDSHSRSDMLHQNKTYPGSVDSSRMPNPGHLFNPFNLRPPLGVPPNIYGSSTLDVLNPYARFGAPVSSPGVSPSTPSPFGGLGSVRSDPFGLRPGMWPLKSESSLLSVHERKRREEQFRKEREIHREHRNYVRERERNGNNRDNSRSPIRSSSLSGSPSGRSNASPLVPTKKEDRPGSVLDMSRPGSSSSVKQAQDDCIVVVPPPIVSSEGRLNATTPNGRTSVNSNTSRTTPTNRPPSATRSPQVLQQRPESSSHNSRAASSTANPYGMFGQSVSSTSNNPSMNSPHMGIYGLPPFGLDPFRDPYKSLMSGAPPYPPKDHLREARERELLRQNPLGSMIVNEQDRVRMVALSGGYPPHTVAGPSGGYLGHPPMLNQSYGSALKSTPVAPPTPHLGMYPGFPGHHGLPPSLNGHGPPGSSAPYK